MISFRRMLGQACQRAICGLVELISRTPKLRAVFYRCVLRGLVWPVKSLADNCRAHYWKVHFRALGEGATISENVKIQKAGNISIGRETRINNRTILNGRGGITIGDYVLVGFESMILTSNHNYQDLDTPIRYQGSTSKPVVIGNEIEHMVLL